MRKFIRNYTILFTLTFYFFSCQPQNKPISTGNQVAIPLEKISLRSAPSQDADENATLTSVDTLFLTGQVSKSTSRINFNGVIYNDPWVEVSTKNHKKGWVYAAQLNFSDQKQSPVFSSIIQQRLINFTNDVLAEKVNQYAELYNNASTSTDFHQLWEMADSLRPQLQKLLSEKIVFNDEDAVFPDFSWIESLLPGFITIVSGHQCFLFRDFKSLGLKVISTTGKEDDDLLAVCEAVYCLDSIEYFDPCWNIEEESAGLHSLLGDGIHLDIASKIDTALYRSDMFQQQLYQIKKTWMQDIAGKSISYWNDSNKIIRELQQILDSDFRMLNQSDKTTIETRIKMFREPDKNEIRLNQRAGLD